VAIPLSVVGTLAIMLSWGSPSHCSPCSRWFWRSPGRRRRIIVVENVNRHLEEGKPGGGRSPAGRARARESHHRMTVCCWRVHSDRLSGRSHRALFTEFAFHAGGRRDLSAIIALTLSPMMCSRLLHPHRADKLDWESRS